MTDLEITKLCAEATATPIYSAPEFDGVYLHPIDRTSWNRQYDPLHDDAQAMALFKRFKLWEWIRDGSLTIDEHDTNRSICECVAKMQKAKCHD